jgi:hypothetical protein
MLFISIGKALLLLSEEGFKQRSSRSGDILYKALQQHNALIKSLNCQSRDFNSKSFQKNNQSLFYSFTISIME